MQEGRIAQLLAMIGRRGPGAAVVAATVEMMIVSSGRDNLTHDVRAAGTVDGGVLMTESQGGSVTTGLNDWEGTEAIAAAQAAATPAGMLILRCSCT